MRLTIHFQPTADNEVGPHVRARFEIEVAAFGPFHAVFIETAKPIARLLGRCSVCRGNVEWHPPNARSEEIWPATITGIVVLPSVLGFQTAPVHQTAGNAA